MAYTQKGHRFFQYRQEPPVELGLAGRQDHIAFNRDGTRVVVSAKGARSVWDAVAGDLVATFPRTNIDTIACLNSLGSRLCSVDPEGLTCWSVSPRRVLWSAPIRSQDTFSDIQWSPSDRWIAFQLAKSRIALVSAETGTLLGYLEHPDARMIRHLAFSNDGRWLAIACAKGVTQLWDLKKLHVELAQLGLDWPE